MSEHANAFVQHLQSLALRDRGAIAALRRSLAFAPGTYPPAYPAVERFAAQGEDREAARRALYLCAGLFALHPAHASGRALATGLGETLIRRDSPSIEKRFIALLGADPDALADHLRQAISLLAADGVGLDYVLLLADLRDLLDPWNEERRDRARQRWARAFYRVAAHEHASEPGTDAADDQS
ncbi:type I-E CRISPR-associated protein Cse2/CasB [Rubrivivax gelatinosus]|uniref:CRISPR-associated protein, Cse2 family n=1 Tax=Rubrivivax gelatinosus (strain NBRC 100245 / IL144) TaxID=983917 RepID=I0HLZ5_RUBGI|nr:type I-E CRISPR-associated protein Cse2/CasB [Rubrivivax gelatinosus]BAL94032.1 CRISPR-associated protein, Cse2 family [Rubrivivax gelatinosus IL144]